MVFSDMKIASEISFVVFPFNIQARISFSRGVRGVGWCDLTILWAKYLDSTPFDINFSFSSETVFMDRLISSFGSDFNKYSSVTCLKWNSIVGRSLKEDKIE